MKNGLVILLWCECSPCQKAMELFRALQESHEFSYKEVKFRSEEGEFLSRRFTISRTPTAVINDHTLFSIY